MQRQSPVHLFMDKFSTIKNNIASIISLNDEELLVLCESFEVKALKKNEFFLREGQICNFIGFVNRGVLIYFKSLDTGNDVTIDFAFESHWVTINESRLKNSPSIVNIKAIENAELLVIKQQDLSDLYIKIPKIERLGRILMEQSFLRIAEQSVELQLLTARERYESLLTNHPEIFKKVPLHHIANYLGIAPKSLSRIRAEISFKR